MAACIWLISEFGVFSRIPEQLCTWCLHRKVSRSLLQPRPHPESSKMAAGGASGSLARKSATKSGAGWLVGDTQPSDRRMGGLEGRNGTKKSFTVCQSLWLASNPSKRWGEAFFLLYTPFWLTLTIGIVVPCKLYERFTELEYLLLGLVSTIPAFLIPLFVVGEVHTITPCSFFGKIDVQSKVTQKS